MAKWSDTTYDQNTKFTTPLPDKKFLVSFPRDVKILDAGCGNGTYGLWLLQKHAKDMGQGTKKTIIPSYVYMGLDFISSALHEAGKAHEKALQSLNQMRRGHSFPLTFLYMLADLNEKLPFIDAYFHKICCNLVVLRCKFSVIKSCK